ncbi:MAG: hypothetical protein JXQ80_09925 [Bacteroidales bacterium]|nr:hypothetical protein [Bacteroidales bacterium]
MRDKPGAKEYFPKGESAPLLQLYKDSLYFKPESFQYDQETNKISLQYHNGTKALIKIENKSDYLRFELLSVEPRNGIEAVVWGPYPTTIQEKIGETIGVVRNKEFAIGVQGLNIKTIEGLPYGDNAGGYFIDPLPNQQVPDSIKEMIGQKIDVDVNVTGDMPEYVRLYRGTTAVKKEFGSEIRFFARDYRLPRVIPVWEGPEEYKQYVEPIDVDFIGSAIALFGCPEEKTLDIIEKIELGEGLPHPEIDGVWIKRSKVPGQAYLLNEGDPYKSIKYAKECGFKLIHLGDFFQSWGHFGLKTKRFPNGANDIRKATDFAREEGISLGVHTLTMFTSPNDPYVSPFPSDSLCKTGSSTISKGLGRDDTEIFINDPMYFRHLGRTHTIKIGKELINYRAVSSDKPWRLLDCKRGQYGTTIGEYAQGTAIDKLTNNVYSGFYPDIHLQDAYAQRLAEVCNETGIDLMDFDGYPHGASSPTGHDHYAGGLFIETWYKNLDRYRLTCGAGTFHYYWHIYSFMNWGEPWYDALRESQVNYRVENQRYFDRNLMPGMLGWFTLNPEFRPEEVEWIQARSAGFDAGYLLRVDESIEKSGFRDELFEAIREWQKARNQKAFTPEQLDRLKNPQNEFHLEKVSDNQWNLYSVELFRDFEHKFRMTQTGEPVSSKFAFENHYADQPIKFYITALPVDGNKTATISNLTLTINGYQSITIKKTLKPGDRVMCDGKSIWLCDFYWKKLEELKVSGLSSFLKGQNKMDVTSDFSGDKAPVLKFELKVIGDPQLVGR